MQSRHNGLRFGLLTIVAVVSLTVFLGSCRGNDFAGGTGSSGGGSGEVPMNSGNSVGAARPGEEDRQAGVGGGVGAAGGGGAEGAGVVTTGGDATAPDYRSCAALPVQGKQRYPAKCGLNQVLVIVNDGGTQEMTCCPLKNGDMLSSTPGDLYQERQGRCLADEVGVGMINSGRTLIFNTNNPRLYCSRINTNKFSLGPPKRSDYVSTNSALPPELLAIAASYHALDACVCPPKSIMLGGHSTDNNSCQDQCAEILPK